MKKRLVLLFTLLLSILVSTHAQMITGVWKGKVGNGLRSTKLELKLVLKGDSIVGTSYYYDSPTKYRRYAVKGYFNASTNEVVWWDDVLLEVKTPRNALSSPGELPLMMEADFNCPGGDVMMLDGNAKTKETQTNKGELHLDKTGDPSFHDEWDYLIENYTTGANDPLIIDSIATLYKIQKQPTPVIATPVPQEIPRREEPTHVLVQQDPPKQEAPIQPIQKTTPSAPTKKEAPVLNNKPPAIQEKFIERKKVLTTELPLEGDTIEIHFYDNAEIDGDSISLFMNNQLVFEHVRLSDKPYIVKFAVNTLSEANELVMVAENLGSIPPNTSYMIAWINNQRYTANLESTENSSAMIRFVRKKE